MTAFTLKERQILRSLVAGRCPDQIADEMEATVGTVNLHLREIQAKAGLAHRYQIIPYVLQNPACLSRRGALGPGLHPVNPDCPCYYCTVLHEQPRAA
jgi:DNA-binding CsgD family transcriptional regulator